MPRSVIAGLYGSCMIVATAAAKSLQSCLTLCDPIDGSPPGSPVPGILQARTLEWVAISFSNAWKWKVKVKSLSHVRLLATSWTAAYQAPSSMGFSRQEYWSRVPLPSPHLTLNHLLKCPFFRSSPSNFFLCCLLKEMPNLRGDDYVLFSRQSRRLKPRTKPLRYLWGMATKQQEGNQDTQEFLQ